MPMINFVFGLVAGQLDLGRVDDHDKVADILMGCKIRPMLSRRTRARRGATRPSARPSASIRTHRRPCRAASCDTLLVCSVSFKSVSRRTAVCFMADTLIQFGGADGI